MTFRTAIYHPNIDSGGRICLDTLNMPPKGAWKPSINIGTRVRATAHPDGVRHTASPSARPSFDTCALRRHRTHLAPLAPRRAKRGRSSDGRDRGGAALGPGTLPSGCGRAHSHPRAARCARSCAIAPDSVGRGERQHRCWAARSCLFVRRGCRSRRCYERTSPNSAELTTRGEASAYRPCARGR